MNALSSSTKLAATTALAFLLTSSDLIAKTDSGSEDRPNIVLFLVDDMGWMDSTPYGSEYYETPNMERLQRQSMRFTNAYAVPLCSPTRASILTGQYSSRHRITSATGHQPARPATASPYPETASANKRFIYANSKNYLDLDFVTLAEVLQGAGYRTGHFGKWHLGLSQQHWPDKHGFDVAFHGEPSPGPSSYFSPYGVHAEGEPSGRHHVGTITDGEDGEYITDRLTDEAIQFIEQNQDQPFFLNFWHYAVHGPWGHKEEYTSQFSEKSDPRGQQENPIMASMLKSVDESLGRVIEKLDELELTDNTLFIFYSDNGGNTHSNIPSDRRFQNIREGHAKWELFQDWRKWAGDQPPTNNSPLREGKGRIYEGGQRVPLMIRWPGNIEPSSISDAVVGPIDMYPTILEVAGLELPTDHIVDGESLVPVITQTGPLDREAYFTWFPHLVPAVSVRQGNWKLIRRFEPHPNYPQTRELYNLAEDIGESSNLADEHPAKVDELDALIDRFVEDTDALYPKPNPDFGKPVANTNNESTSITGLVPRSCRIVETDDAIRVVIEGRQPFFGTAQVKLRGPLTLKLRLKAEAAGEWRVHWRMAGQDTFPESTQIVKFEVEGNADWQDVEVPIPIQGRPSIIRLHFPDDADSIELQQIKYTNKDNQEKTWTFQE